MRFIPGLLLALTLASLAACASDGGPASGSDRSVWGMMNGSSSGTAAGDIINAARTGSGPARSSSTWGSASDRSAGPVINIDHSSPDQFSGPDTDLWARIRRGFQIPDLHGDLVDAQVNWYAKRPDYVARMTARSQRYLYYIVQELEARHMPTELALLPFTESAYNPQAKSVARASGMWQFIPGTGRTYNLKQNMWQDERNDVRASTGAALDYLSRLHTMFGDWYLALAAYNWGERNVQRAIARNQAAGLPTDYQSLNMPSETRNYVPKLQAVKNIVINPQAYGLTLPPIPNHPYFVTVTTAHDIDVDVAAKLANLPVDEFRALNPSFKKPVILGATNPQILLPFENASAFARNLKAATGPLSSWTTYTLSARATPTEVAQKVGVDASTLMSVNNIPAGMRLKPGSTVLVPRMTGDEDEDISADVAESGMLAMEPDVPNTRKMLIRVRHRQTYESVASRYGVTAGQLRAWNGARRDWVAAGQVLMLHVPLGRSFARASRSMASATSRSVVSAERAEASAAHGAHHAPPQSGRHAAQRADAREERSRHAHEDKHGRVHATLESGDKTPRAARERHAGESHSAGESHKKAAGHGKKHK